MEELKQKYKELPLLARLAGIVVLSLLPGAYTWYDESEALDAKLVAAHAAEDTNRAQFERDRSKRGNRPKLEEQKAFITEQLAKAKKKLPEEVRTEDVLNKTATIAKETGVRVKVFRPGKETRGGDEFKYFEVPVTFEISGKFNQIASFFDRVVHLDGTVFVRKIDLAPEPPPIGDADGAKVSAFERGRRERAELTLAANFEIVVYRAMSDIEQASAGPDDGGVPAGNAPGARKKHAPPPAAPADAPGQATPEAPVTPGAPPMPAMPQAMNETTVLGGKRKL